MAESNVMSGVMTGAISPVMNGATGSWGLLRFNLGYWQVYDGDFLSYSQAGGFSSAYRDGSDALARGPSTLYPNARLRRRSIASSSMLSGLSGRTLLLWGILGQSNGGDATDNNAGTSDPLGVITALPSIPGRFKMFNGGLLPHQFGRTKASGAHTTAIDVAQITSLADAREGANALVTGETLSAALGTAFTAMCPSSCDVLVFNRCVGSCDWNEIIGATAASPAQPAADIATMISRAVTLSGGLGYTNVIFVGLVIAGHEADSNLVALANFETKRAQCRTLVDGWKALTGQTFTPLIVQPQVANPRGTDAIHETDVNVLDQASMMALGPAYTSRVIDTNWLTFPQWSHVGGGNDAGATGGVHYGVWAKIYTGEKIANKAADALMGLGRMEPYMVPNTPSAISIWRYANSATLNITLSESCAVKTNVGVTSPGANRGFTFRAGSTKTTVTAATVSGTTATLTLASVPAIADNKVSFAFNNATEFVAPVLGVSQGVYGIGRATGLRGDVYGVEPLGYSIHDGSTLESGLLIADEDVDVFASTSRISAALTELGMTMKMVLDFADASTTPDGTTQTVTNVGSSGATNNFYRGLNSGSDARDPTFTGSAGSYSRSTYFLYDGGDMMTPVGTPDVWVNAHKAGNGATWFIAGYKPSGVSAAQYLAATTTLVAGGAAGVGVSISATGRAQFVVKDASNATVYSLAGSAALADNDFYIFCGSVKDGQAGSWIYDNVNGFTTATPAYSSPSAAAAMSVLTLGQNGAAGTARLDNLSRQMFIICDDTYITRANALPLIRTLYRRQMLGL